jgi:NADPH2:quinone reductase
VLASEALTIKTRTSKRSLDLKMAAALPVTIPSAYSMLAEVARAKQGDIILIHGASGGIGQVAGQIARLLVGDKGMVIGTVGHIDKVEHAKDRGGYDEVIVRDGHERAINAFLGMSAVNVVLQPSGEPFSDLLAPFGRVIVFGNTDGRLATPITGADLLRRNQGLAGFSITNLIANAPEIYKSILRTALDLLISGTIQLDIDREYDLRDVAAAHRHLESGTSSAEIILRTEN